MLGKPITPEIHTIEEFAEIIQNNAQIYLSPITIDKIVKGRKYLDAKLDTSTEPIYGINTGFGALCDVKIDKENLIKLQENLVRSHACGLGKTVPDEIIKWMLLLKIQSLSYGYSGVHLTTIERLIGFFNQNCLPVVYQQGSLGASGDLSPLAHLSLPLIGEGEMFVDGFKLPTAEVNKKMKWLPLKLQSKEGLALLNGTQFMSAYGAFLVTKFERIIQWSIAISAISIDAFDAKLEPFHSSLHEVRHHKGQQEIALLIRKWLKASELAQQAKSAVQDPYSFRCIPQVIGASWDVLQHVKQVFTNEINSVTDNPTIFPNEDLILSGGNFHGQPLAMALDYLSIAMHEVGSISERRVYQLISGKRDLPPFLVANPGLNSGLMIPQYTAASIVSQNKQLCTPASIDTIDSSAGQEDHVSMGANAATKAYRILENVEKILAIELFTAAQALNFRTNAKTSNPIQQLINDYRLKVSFVENDRILYNDLKNSIEFIQNYSLQSINLI
jgi:histidine ammonia-lyase